MTYKYGMWIFFLVSIGHLAEHITQVFQIYVLGWLPGEANGILGMIWPWLIDSEVLHYAFALIMLIGIILLRSVFNSCWWDIALGIQIWHHFEHLLLITQAAIGYNFWGSPVPISILQLVFPRVELHFVYNAIVFIPCTVALCKQCAEDYVLKFASITTSLLIVVCFLFMAAKGFAGSDVERTILLLPGGIYTAEDIKANGHLTASEKYKNFQAVHDYAPGPNDKLCPITRTKANPKCTWIINGKVYEFCCPPCITEFVKLAKEKPQEIREPKFYTGLNKWN